MSDAAVKSNGIRKEGELESADISRSFETRAKCFDTMGLPKVRLKLLKEIIKLEMFLELGSNHIFHYLRKKKRVGDGPVVSQDV